jgi:hypothetical protein
MSDTRKLVALVIAVLGFAVAVFGAVRGLTSTGPASGTRLIVAGELGKVQAVVGTRGRVMAAGDNHAVVEVVQRDPALESQLKIERADAFTRATGFWPRARVFFAVAAVMLAAAAVLLFKR